MMLPPNCFLYQNQKVQKSCNKKTYVIINKRIWWEGKDGVFHDGTPGLPIHLRDGVDNAWIEQSRKWQSSKTKEES